MNAEFKLQDLIENLNVQINGDANCLITGIAPIHKANKNQVTFLTNAAYKKYLLTTKAGAVILSADFAADCPVTAIICANPHYTYAKIAERFLPKIENQQGLHETVVVGENTNVAATAYIGPHVVIGNNVTIHDYVKIGAGSYIGDHTVIGAHTELNPKVTLLAQTKIGSHCFIDSGVVIGSEGLGYAAQSGAWHKVPQMGGVCIGNAVDIGANTCIDRGAIDDTIIEDGVKLDNLIQVAHNAVIGAHTIVAGCVAIAGSTVIGKHCMIGGGSCLAGHITIADRVMITGMSAVTKSIKEPGMYSSGIVGAVPNHEFRKNNARFHRLEQLMNRVKFLESKIKKIKE